MFFKSLKDMTSDDCVVCMQPYDLPVMLDCGHVFCYICLKTANKSKDECPLCRAIITIDINRVVQRDLESKVSGMVGSPVWLYESNSKDGWWIYGVRSCTPLEDAYTLTFKVCCCK